MAAAPSTTTSPRWDMTTPRARGRCGSPTPASGPSGTGAASIRSRRSSRRRATRTPTPHPERPGQHHLHVAVRSRVSLNTAPKTTMETDGTYRVGTDIVPGTYRSAGTSPEGATECYWARLSSLNETHIIENNISTGPQLVIIQPGDRAFLTHGCQPWQKAD